MADAPTAPALNARRGQVLSDRDIADEIQNRQLIFIKDGQLADYSEGLQGDCYDFRIGAVIGKGIGSVTGTKSVTLKPGEMATLLSKEWVRLPANVAGMVVPRNGPAQRGILMLNAGHIDPNYEGQIEAQVVNLSQQERSLRLDHFKGGVFSVVFSYLSSPTEQTPAVQESTAKRIADIAFNTGEQAETLVLAESTMRERFVEKDNFSTLLLFNVLGFMSIVALLVGTVAGLSQVTGKTIATNWDPGLLLLLLTIAAAFLLALLAGC